MTDHQTERLRDHLAAAETPAGSDCADPEEIWAAQRGELTGGRVRALLDHSLRCSACAEAWRLAREVGGELPAEAPKSASARTSTNRWLGFGAVAAAAAVAAVFLLVLFPADSPIAPPTFREEGKPGIATLVSEDTPLPRDGATLRWTAGPEGALYDVEVADENLDLLHVERDLTVNELTVPPAALDGMAAGARVLWRVETVLPDGSRVTSPTFTHRLE